MIVVDKNLSEDDAWTLIEHYGRTYDDPDKDFNIDLFCDERYANAESLNLRDTDYYPHTVYSYNRPAPLRIGDRIRRFEPRFARNSAEACR